MSYEYTTENIVESLKKNNGVLVGSRALGVHEENSDWDIAIMHYDLPNELKELPTFDIARYFNVLPLGNAYLIKVPDVDILVYEDISDFTNTCNAFTLLQKIPKFLLKNKFTRCHLIEQCLIYSGLRPTAYF